MSQSPRATAESPVAGRTRQLVEAPITPTLLRLAMPNVVVMMAQAVVSTCEVYFISWLGAEALAGVSLVFPLIMLMQTGVCVAMDQLSKSFDNRSYSTIIVMQSMLL